MPNGWPGERDEQLGFVHSLRGWGLCDDPGQPLQHLSGGTVKRFIVSLPDALNEQLRRAAAAGGESVAVWVREAIRQRLERDQP